MIGTLMTVMAGVGLGYYFRRHSGCCEHEVYYEERPYESSHLVRANDMVIGTHNYVAPGHYVAPSHHVPPAHHGSGHY